jgi:hypothetical protein
VAGVSLTWAGFANTSLLHWLQDCIAPVAVPSGFAPDGGQQLEKSAVPHASRFLSSCARVVTPMMVLATRQFV